jgi:hypothetical protein
LFLFHYVVVALLLRARFYFIKEEERKEKEEKEVKKEKEKTFFPLLRLSLYPFYVKVSSSLYTFSVIRLPPFRYLFV